MEEELSRQWEKLSLTEREKEGVSLAPHNMPTGREQALSCLMVMIMAEKIINKEAFKSTMAKIWRCTSWIQFSEVGPNKFLVEFNSDQDLKRVIEGRPWAFDRWLLCLQTYDGSKSINEIVFNKEEFWLQVYDVPLSCMTQETGLLLGSYVGKVLKVHADDRGISWGKYLRIRVEVDITKALLRGTFLNVEGKKCWVPFKYERLPSICFKCGTIKHNHLACLSATSRGGSQQYGAWLRAPATKDSDLQLKKYGEAADPEGQVHDQSWRRETEGREDLQGGSPAITDGCQERNLASDRLDCKIVDRSDIQGAERLTRQGNFPRQVGTQKLAGKGVPPLNPPN
ncbi:hypothetical protein I3760_13G120100, partial [Carya illinoinensis]